jgi:hypothetical protein
MVVGFVPGWLHAERETTETRAETRARVTPEITIELGPETVFAHAHCNPGSDSKDSTESRVARFGKS